MELWLVFQVVGSVGIAGWSGYRATQARSSVAVRATLALIALDALLFAATPFRSLAPSVLAPAFKTASLTVAVLFIVLYIVATNGFKATLQTQRPGLLTEYGVKCGTYPSTSLSQTHKLLAVARCPEVNSDVALAAAARDVVSLINATIALAIVLVFSIALSLV